MPFAQSEKVRHRKVRRLKRIDRATVKGEKTGGAQKAAMKTWRKKMKKQVAK